MCFRKISGLNATKAANIIEYRNKNGPFINREQLKLIKGVGLKSFQQCAGFIRIVDPKEAADSAGDPTLFSSLKYKVVNIRYT